MLRLPYLFALNTLEHIDISKYVPLSNTLITYLCKIYKFYVADYILKWDEYSLQK